MGLQFGNLAKVNGIVFFRLSPHEQKAFAGVINHGIPNILRRINGRIFRISPFVLTGYLIFKWAKEENRKLSRKNPKDFENDK